MLFYITLLAVITSVVPIPVDRELVSDDLFKDNSIEMVKQQLQVRSSKDNMVHLMMQIADKDKDDELSKNELTQFYIEYIDMNASAAKDLSNYVFPRVDDNDNGTLNKEEAATMIERYGSPKILASMGP